jgi:hypothetical protein
MILENASPLEIGWTAVGIVTTGIMIVVLKFFWYRCKMAFNNPVDVSTRVIALLKIIQTFAFLTIQLGFVIVGFIAMLTPPPIPDNSVTPTGIIVTAGIIWAEVVLTLFAVLELMLIRWATTQEHPGLADAEKRKVIWTEERRRANRS